jgi:hypothetical protein
MINERQKPYQTTIEEQQLRWDYAEGKITLDEFDRRYERLKKRGKIRRNGKVVT